MIIRKILFMKKEEKGRKTKICIENLVQSMIVVQIIMDETGETRVYWF